MSRIFTQSAPDPSFSSAQYRARRLLSSAPMTIDIRNIREDELPAFLEAMGAGFLDRVDGVKVAAEVGPFWDFARIWSGFDGDAVVGTFRTWATELTVPGGAQLP